MVWIMLDDFLIKKKVFFYKNKCKNWNVKVKKIERDKVFCNVFVRWLRMDLGSLEKVVLVGVNIV